MSAKGSAAGSGELHYHVECTDNDCDFAADVRYEYEAEEGKSRHESWNGNSHVVEISQKRGAVEFTSTQWDQVEDF